MKVKDAGRLMNQQGNELISAGARIHNTTIKKDTKKRLPLIVSNNRRVFLGKRLCKAVSLNW